MIKNGADVNYFCPSKYLTAATSLHSAVLEGHMASVRLLHNGGADTSIRFNSGETLLMAAVRLKYYSIIDFLLKKSINTTEDLELAICSLINIFNTKSSTIYTYLSILPLHPQSSTDFKDMNDSYISLFR